MTGYVGFIDPALPKVIENVESTTVPESPDAFSEADKVLLRAAAATDGGVNRTPSHVTFSRVCAHV